MRGWWMVGGWLAGARGVVGGKKRSIFVALEFGLGRSFCLGYCSVGLGWVVVVFRCGEWGFLFRVGFVVWVGGRAGGLVGGRNGGRVVWSEAGRAKHM